MPPVDSESIRKVIEEEFGRPCEAIFDYFEDEPLKKGEQVVVEEVKGMILKVKKA